MRPRQVLANLALEKEFTDTVAAAIDFPAQDAKRYRQHTAWRAVAMHRSLLVRPLVNWLFIMASRQLMLPALTGWGLAMVTSPSACHFIDVARQSRTSEPAEKYVSGHCPWLLFGAGDDAGEFVRAQIRVLSRDCHAAIRNQATASVVRAPIRS